MKSKIFITFSGPRHSGKGLAAEFMRCLIHTHGIPSDSVVIKTITHDRPLRWFLQGDDSDDRWALLKQGCKDAVLFVAKSESALYNLGVTREAIDLHNRADEVEFLSATKTESPDAKKSIVLSGYMAPPADSALRQLYELTTQWEKHGKPTAFYRTDSTCGKYRTLSFVFPVEEAEHVST